MLLSLLAAVALIFSALAFAGPVSADPPPDLHCSDHESVLKIQDGGVAPGTTGTVDVDGTEVSYTVSADGLTVTFSESLEFCVKASTDNSGPQSGTTYTVDFLNPGDNNPAISYFVVYGLTDVQEEEGGSITIRKNSVPDNDDDFSFTTTGAGLSGFSLDDDADPTLPRERTFVGLAPGTYTVTEAALAPWTLTQLDCSAGGVGDTTTRTATINLTTGAHVTCTFVNTKHASQNPGQITIRKNAVPDLAQDFAFMVTGGELQDFMLDDDPSDATLPREVTFSGLNPGTYTFTESEVDEWVLTQLDCSTGGSGDVATRMATIVLVPGAHVTCTFVNVKHPHAEPGSLTIIKDADPNGAQDFAFSTTGSGLSAFSLDDDADPTLSNQMTFSGLAAGTYTVSEAAIAGWTLTSIACTAGGTGDTTTSTAIIEITAGLDVTCTFTNQGNEGEEPGGGGPGPNEPPREGTQGGNPLPDTATSPIPTGSVPAALLALLMLAGLGAAGYTVRAEVLRRR